MASGFFLGGFGEGLSNSFDNTLNTASTIKYRQSILQLEQQRQQNEQMRQQQADYQGLAKQYIDNLAQHVDADKIEEARANPQTPADILQSRIIKRWSQQAEQAKQMFSQGFQHLGMKDYATVFDSQVTNILASPPSTALKRAEAEATGEAGLRQSEVQKNQAATQNYRANAGLPVSDNNNPDRPGLPQNGPALGDKTAQAAQVDAPKVLSWGDARASVAQKYTPEIATKAELWLKGNTSVVTGLRGGRGGEREKIQNAAMDLANLTGMTPDQINQNFIQYKGQQAASTAGGRTAGSREANLGIILTAADSAIDAAITASNNVDRSNFVPLNRAQQTGQASISDPKLKVFQQKNLQLADLWAKSFNPTGALRIDDRNLALDVLNTAIGKGTYATAANAIRDSIGLERGAAIKFLKSKGFTSGDTSTQGESSGAEPGPGGLTVHGFTFTPTGQ